MGATPDPAVDEKSTSLERGTYYRRVYQALLADIVSGTFAPGARLKIAELVERYGLSPMPIREALQQLQGEGLVVMSPNKGASVRPIDLKFVSDIYQVRGALYAIVYTEVMATADAEFDALLDEIQERFDAMVAANDMEGCRRQNQLLHAKIQERCLNQEVTDLMNRYANLTSSLRDLFGYDLVRVREISEEHWMIIEAVHARDLPRAIAAAQHHVNRALDSMSGFIRREFMEKKNDGIR